MYNENLHHLPQGEGHTLHIHLEPVQKGDAPCSLLNIQKSRKWNYPCTGTHTFHSCGVHETDIHMLRTVFHPRSGRKVIEMVVLDEYWLIWCTTLSFWPPYHSMEVSVCMCTCLNIWVFPIPLQLPGLCPVKRQIHLFRDQLQCLAAKLWNPIISKINKNREKIYGNKCINQVENAPNVQIRRNLNFICLPVLHLCHWFIWLLCYHFRFVFARLQKTVICLLGLWFSFSLAAAWTSSLLRQGLVQYHDCITLPS